MNKIGSYLVGVALVLGSFAASGQGMAGLQRGVEYATSTCTLFSIPCDKDPDSLSQLDLVYLERKPAFLRKAKFEIQDGWLSITNVYPQRPRYERDYEYQKGKSVTDKWGTRLYYHDGDEYYNLENETENEDFLLDGEAVSGYGFYNGLFSTSIEEIQAFCDSVGMPAYVWGQKLLIVQEDTAERREIETDFEQLYFEMRLYRNNVHVLSDRADYQRVGGYIIPAKNTRVYYSELPSETRYQITEVETYQSYKVTGLNDSILVDWEPQSNLPFSITVTPNPADSQIVVQFSSQLDGAANLKIKNATQAVVLEENLTTVPLVYLMDITALASGLYTVVCVHENDTAEASFVKEGIGQYPVQVVVGIQVVPNPAQDQIAIYFSESINAVMNVKIIDLMGIKYLDVPMYVAGNTLQITDISYLPAGAYYVFCTNSEWTGNAQFMKN